MNYKKILTLFMFTLLLVSVVSATTLTRTISPETISPGESFTVTYTATSNEPEWFVGFGDTVSCGNDVEFFMISNSGQSSKSEQFTFTAPSSGTCTFTNGYYQFTKQSQKALSDVTLSSSGSTPNGGTPSTGNGEEEEGFGAGLIWIVVIIAGVLLFVLNKK